MPKSVAVCAALLVLLAPAVVWAQGAPPVCAAVDANLPAPWTGWTKPETLSGGASVATAGKLAPGHDYTAALVDSAAATYAVPLAKPSAPGSYAGLFSLTIDAAGTYSIALSEGAWIDVAPAGGQALESVSHSHGPDCTSIHKVVDFALKPGVYIVQISGAPKSPVVIGVQPKA